MKKTAVLTLLFINSMLSFSQSQLIEIRINDSLSYSAPQVKPYFEKFDFDHYNHLMQKDSIEETYVYETFSEVEYFFNITEDRPSSVEVHYNSYFNFNKKFHPNGTIKEKGLYFNANYRFKKGTWYYFDQVGNLTDSIDYDKGYDFTFEDVVRFCIKENIPLPKGPIYADGYFHTKIHKLKTEEGKPYWDIDYFLREEHAVVQLRLDAKTGKILDEYKSDYTY